VDGSVGVGRGDNTGKRREALTQAYSPATVARMADGTVLRIAVEAVDRRRILRR